MSIFCRKKINPPECLGDWLKKQRESHNLDLEAFTLITHIPLKYLQALETSRWSELPSCRAHRFAYLKEYARQLELDFDKIAKRFKKEGGEEKSLNSGNEWMKKYKTFQPICDLLRNLGVAVLVLIIGGYLVWQIRGVLQPPKLTIYHPAEGYVSGQMNILVQGQTERETKLVINGQEIRPNDNGQFESNIDLSNGVNTITISAIKKHGKTTTIVRHIVAKISESKKVGYK